MRVREVHAWNVEDLAVKRREYTAWKIQLRSSVQKPSVSPSLGIKNFAPSGNNERTCLEIATRHPQIF